MRRFPASPILAALLVAMSVFEAKAECTGGPKTLDDVAQIARTVGFSPEKSANHLVVRQGDANVNILVVDDKISMYLAFPVIPPGRMRYLPGKELLEFNNSHIAQYSLSKKGSDEQLILAIQHPMTEISPAFVKAAVGWLARNAQQTAQLWSHPAGDRRIGEARHTAWMTEDRLSASACDPPFPRAA